MRTQKPNEQKPGLRAAIKVVSLQFRYTVFTKDKSCQSVIYSDCTVHYDTRHD